MNKHCYRIIFSRTQGELRVVSELARSRSTHSGQSRGMGIDRLWVTLRRTAWLLGLALFTEPVLAAGIVADGSAPAAQRPEVIATPNGLPQVNINAPNKSGVSHNQFSQFDVDKKGAILNNSAVATSTQLAGYIQGNGKLNPNGPAARVILNEVNSNNPSQLRGFLEVAGGKAQVIVANPSGIVCDGCGTINAGRMTLTTGKPQLNADGSLAGYQVERGTIRIEGGGLNGDARHDTGYVDILARAVEVNAGVRANDTIKVVAGRNRISADAASVTPLAADGNAPAPELAIDMGQMGGMYSGHISMIGTEAGVGVRNQGGHLQAGKTLSVSSEGRLTWQPAAQEASTQAGGDIRLSAKDDIDHQGKLHSGGELVVESREGAIRHAGTLAAAGNVTLDAASGINNSGNILAGSDTNSTLTAPADLTLTSKGDVQSSGSLLSQKKISVSGKQVNLDNGKIAAGSSVLQAQKEGVSLRKAHIDSGELTVNTTGDIAAQQAEIRAGRWDVTGDNLFAGQSLWSQVDTGESRFALTGTLDNSGGSIEASELSLQADALTNQQGRLVSLGDGAQRWNVTGLLDNQNGVLGGNGSLDISAGRFDNRNGELSGGGDMTLSAVQIDNQQGRLFSQGSQWLKADEFFNTGGWMGSQGSWRATGGRFDNREGTVLGQQGAALSLDELDNGQGKIHSGGALSLDAERVDNGAGQLVSGAALALNTRTLDNTGGQLQSGGTLDLARLDRLDNNQGRILASDALNINNGEQSALKLANRAGDIQSGSRMAVNTDSLDNQGGSLMSEQALTLSIGQDYTHGKDDKIASNGVLNLTIAGALINQGRIEADTLSIASDTVNNTDALIANHIDVNARTIDNTGPEALIAAADSLRLQSEERLSNLDGGFIYSGGDLTLISKDLIENRSSTIEAEGDITLEADRLDNVREGLNIARSAESSSYNLHLYNYYWRSLGNNVNANPETIKPTTQHLTFKDDADAQSNPYGTILQIDAANKRAQVRVKNNQGNLVDLWVNYLALTPNDAYGYDMTFYQTLSGSVPTPYHHRVWREAGIGSVEIWDPNRHVDIYNAPYISDYNNFRERTMTGTTTRDVLISAGTGASIVAGGDILLRIGTQLLNDAATISANGNLKVEGQGNIINRGYSVNERRQEHYVDHYDRNKNHWYPTYNYDNTTALMTFDGILTGNGKVALNGSSIENATVNQAQISAQDAAQKAADAAREEWERNPLSEKGEPLTARQQLDRVGTNIPDNGLFRQQTAAGSPYLVVTDPRFTDKGNFLSSDYLLQRLGYQPEAVHKRLGDGYYEQRVVREQLLDLTGRPSLHGDDAMAQYQALMNNGASVASDFSLQPGVALTPEQIASLQKDIVWLVSETVDTVDGPQTVWVPKVYLANDTLQLTGDGALIGGGELQLSANSITNAGNIYANGALNIEGKTFSQSGGDIRGDTVTVNADSISLSTNLQDALRQASISGRDVTLNGDDISLKGASLAATENLNLTASNSLDIGTARSSHTADLEVISGAMGNRTGAGMEEAGKRMAQVSGEWQQALGSTLSAGENLSLNAGKDITLKGSQAQADGKLDIQAGGDISLLADTTTNRTHLKANSTTSSVDNTREADTLHLTTLSGKGGVNIKVGDSLVTQAAQIDSEAGDIRLEAQQIEIAEAHQRVSDRDSEGWRKTESDVNSVTGSTLSSRNDISVVSGGDLTVRGSTLHSEEGALDLEAKDNITITSATETDYFRKEETRTKKGPLQSSSSYKLTEDRFSREKGSLLSGNTVNVNAGNDLAVKGSSVVGTGDVTLQAGNNVDIVAATESESRYLLEEKKKSGLMGSGGIGFTIGSNSQRREVQDDATTHSQSFSTVGSTGGSVSITAGNQLHVGGADLVAAKDLSLTGDSVLIDPGHDKRTTTETFESKSTGLTVALSGAVGSALNSAISASQAAKESSDDRLKALNTTKAVLSGVQAVQGGVLANVSGDPNNGVGVSISLSTQNSKSVQRTESDTVSGSTLNAGNNLAITATGNNKGDGSGDIVVAGSQLKAGKDTTLDAANDVLLLGAANTQEMTGKNSSSGGGVGVSIGAGAGSAGGGGSAGISVFANVNAARGKENGTGTVWSETTLDSGGTTSIKTGRDLALTGAQVSGEKVVADVGRDLLMKSQQDVNDYDSKQTSVAAGGSFTFGSMTGSGYLSLSQDKMTSNYQSVQEQTGIFAGQGGFDLTVGSHTQLDGAVIASTATADKNSLDTGTLGFSDIHNEADFKTSHSGISLSGSGGGEGGGPLGSFGGDVFKGITAGGMLSAGGNSGHAEGTTKSAVAEGSITVRDAEKQQQDVAQLSRDTDNANGSIGQIFDKEKEQNRLAQAQLIGEIGGQALDIARTQGDINGLKEAKKSHPNLSADDLRKTDAYKKEMQKYGTGSDIQRGIQAATAALQGLAGGNMGQALTGAAAPYLAEQIHELTKNDPAAKAVAHAVLGAVTSYAAGNSALAGAAGAVTGELMAKLVMDELYPGKKVSELSETEKQTVSILGTLAAGLAGGVAGNSTTDAVAGGQAGKNAVENNSLMLEGFGTGFWSNVQSQGSLVNNTNLTDENGKLLNPATPEEIKYASDKLVTGEVPEGQDPARGLLTAWGAGANTVVAPVLLPSGATAGLILAGGAISGTTNLSNQVAKGGPISSTDALIATGIGAVTQGRGVWFTEVASVVGAYGGAKLQGKEVLPAVIGAGFGTFVGDKTGKAITNQIKPVVSDTVSQIVGAGTGAISSEVSGSLLEDKMKQNGD